MSDPTTPSGRTLAQWLIAPSPVTPESGIALIVGAEQEAAEAERARIRAALESLPASDWSDETRTVAPDYWVRTDAVLAILDPRSDKEPT